MKRNLRNIILAFITIGLANLLNAREVRLNTAIAKSLATPLAIPSDSASTPEYKMLDVVSISKKAYQSIDVPKVIADKETAHRIFEKLNVEFGNIDFSKNVVCLATLDINDHDPMDCHIKPHYSEDGEYLYIQHLCRLRLREKSDKRWVQPDKLWVQVVRISKGRTRGFQVYDYSKKRRNTVLKW
ncbi:MAG: hypothetical protein VW879_10065 [Opitutae bacterium]